MHAAILLCAAIAAACLHPAWAQEPEPLWVDAEVIDEKTVRIFGNVGNASHETGEVSIRFSHEWDSVPIQQLAVDGSGDFDTVAGVRGDGVYTVRATHLGNHDFAQFYMGPEPAVPEEPAVQPEPETPAGAGPEPPQPPEPAPAPEDGLSFQDWIDGALVAAILPAMDSVAFMINALLGAVPGFPVVWPWDAIIAVAVFIAVVVFALFLWVVPAPDAAGQRPDAGRRRGGSGREAGRSAGAGRGRQHRTAQQSAGGATLAAARPAGAAAPRAPGTGAERDEMRRLLGSGTIIPDTNICVNHLYGAVRDPGITPAALDHIRERLENRADDVAHECLDGAMGQKRIRIPHVIANKELEGHLDWIEAEALGAGAVTREDADIALLIGGLRKSPLFVYCKDPGHVLRRCSDATADRIRGMYEGFRDLDETKGAVASIIERNKPFPPAKGDIYILGTAAELAAGGADVRLLTLDSDFTEFAAQIERELRVTVVDGNPYIRKGRGLFDRKDYAGAAECLWRGTDLNKGSMYGLRYLAKALFHLGERDQGRRVMDRVTVDESDYHSVVGKADLLMLAGDHYEAAVRFGAASRLKPDRAYPLGRRARALMRLAREEKGKLGAGLLREAGELLERARGIEPGNPHVERDIGEVRRRLGIR